MPDGKGYVKLWTSYSAYFEPLGDAEVGRLARAMIEYKSSGAEPKFSGNERFVWPAIKRDMDEAERAMAEFNQKQSENGSKGGRPKKPTGSSENPKNPSLFSETQKSQGLRTMDKGQEEISVSDETDCRTDIRRVMEAWNALGLAKVSRINAGTDRYKQLNRRLKDYGVDEVLRAIQNVGSSDFLMGRTGGQRTFEATFDWFIKPNNFAKVLDGNYANRHGGGEPQQRPAYTRGKGAQPAPGDLRQPVASQMGEFERRAMERLWQRGRDDCERNQETDGGG